MSGETTSIRHGYYNNMRPKKVMVPAGLLLLLTASFLNMSEAVDHHTEELVYAKPGSINSLMELEPTYEFKV